MLNVKLLVHRVTGRLKKVKYVGAHVAMKQNWTKSVGETGPSKVVERLERKVLSYNLGLLTGYRLLSEDSCYFS